MKPLLPLLLASALLASGCREAEKAPDGPPAVSAPWRGEGTTLELTAWELDCPGCKANLEKRIGAVEGVASVKVDATGLVEIRLVDAARRDGVVAKVREVVHSQGKKVVGEDPIGTP